ncbi:MAG: trypsin-like peptidase domain-containing protein, partial [Myxococcota bacterium]
NAGRRHAALRALGHSLKYYVAALRGRRPHRDFDYGIKAIAVQAARVREKSLSAPLFDFEREAALLRRELEASPERSPRIHATKGEVYVALGKYKKAAKSYRRFCEDPQVGTYHLNKELRQLRDVWGIGDGSSESRLVVTILQSALLERPRGSLDVRPEDHVGTPVHGRGSKGQEAKGLGESTPRTPTRVISQVDLAFSRAKSVCRLMDGPRTLGAGFLVNGAELAGSLPDKTLLLTTFSIVSALAEHDLGASWTGPPPRLRAVFEWNDAPAHSVTPLRDSEALDYAVLELEGLGTAPSIPIANLSLPAKTRRPRFYVFGHDSQGSRLTIGDRRFVGHVALEEGDYLRYEERGMPAALGSPVLDESSMSVVALHVRRRALMSWVVPPSEASPTGEGLTLATIQRDLG